MNEDAMHNEAIFELITTDDTVSFYNIDSTSNKIFFFAYSLFIAM